MKILHIEPLEHYRTGLHGAIAKTKYQIAKEVECGDDAMACLEEVRPDIIVMCIVAPFRTSEPGGGGVKLIEEILKKDPNVRIVITHTVDTRYLIMKAIKSGAVSRASKPFIKDKTLDALAQAEAVSGGAQSVMRSKARMKSSLVVWYKLVTEGFLKRMRSAVSTDVSASGMSIRTTEKLPGKVLVRLKIEVPGVKDRIEAQAKVMRMKPIADLGIYDVGLAFTQIDKNDRKALENFVLKTVTRKK